MVNDFKKKMGKPEDTIIAIGDYSDKGLKGTESSITKKTRKIFKRHGYEVYLINEYNTSKLCCCCGNTTENFIKRSKKIGRKQSFVWKLIRCTICKSIHNRDSNAAKNMLKLIDAVKNGKQRPIKYTNKEIPIKNINKKNTKRKIQNRKIIEV